MSAPREKASCWQHKLEAMACNGARNENLRVGIVWNGGETHSLDRFRSIHLDSVKPLFAVQGVTWFSVQKGINERQTESLEAVCDLHTLGPSIDDFTDTLGILEALDLLVTVDTSVAHLAGAAGVPVWVLVPAYSEWRWLKDRTDSPWYPSMRLFRQRQLGDWSVMVDAVRDALTVLTREKTGAKGNGPFG